MSRVGLRAGKTLDDGVSLACAWKTVEADVLCGMSSSHSPSHHIAPWNIIWAQRKRSVSSSMCGSKPQVSSLPASSRRFSGVIGRRSCSSSGPELETARCVSRCMPMRSSASSSSDSARAARAVGTSRSSTAAISSTRSSAREKASDTAPTSTLARRGGELRSSAKPGWLTDEERAIVDASEGGRLAVANGGVVGGEKGSALRRRPFVLVLRDGKREVLPEWLICSWKAASAAC
jgi:hypothetical protein